MSAYKRFSFQNIIPRRGKQWGQVRHRTLSYGWQAAVFCGQQSDQPRVMDRFGGLCQGFICTIGHREQNICVTRNAGLTPANQIFALRFMDNILNRKKEVIQ
jgi:hypothetical protein